MNWAKVVQSVVGLGCAWACSSGTGPVEPPRSPEPKPAPPVQAELRAAPPPSTSAVGGPATGAIGAPFTSDPNAPPPDPPDCVEPTDPELDKESEWSRELGQMLERELPKLKRCSLDLPADDEGQITLRLVYRKDGSPVSQHVVTSTPEACAASECLEQALSSVRAPELLIDQAALDLTLGLQRGEAPKRLSDPVDPLAQDGEPSTGDGCVDAEIAKLSQAKVREVVSTTYDQLQACYGEALMRDHSAAGKVTFEFVIGRDGRVPSAWASDATFRDCAAIGCMLSQFRTLSFPEPVGRAVRIIYPINYVLEQSPVTLR